MNERPITVGSIPRSRICRCISEPKGKFRVTERCNRWWTPLVESHIWMSLVWEVKDKSSEIHVVVSSTCLCKMEPTAKSSIRRMNERGLSRDPWGMPPDKVVRVNSSPGNQTLWMRLDRNEWSYLIRKWGTPLAKNPCITLSYLSALDAKLLQLSAIQIHVYLLLLLQRRNYAGLGNCCIILLEMVFFFIN